MAQAIFLILSPAAFCDVYTCSAPTTPISDLEVVEDVLEVTDDITIEDADVYTDITHTWIGDLLIVVMSPSGTEVTLHDGFGGSADDILANWDDEGRPYGSPFDAGDAMVPSGPGVLGDFDLEVSSGDWLLSVDDQAGGDNGTLNEWCLELSDSETAEFDVALSDLTVCQRDSATGLVEFACTLDIEPGADFSEDGFAASLVYEVLAAGVAESTTSNSVTMNAPADTSCDGPDDSCKRWFLTDERPDQIGFYHVRADCVADGDGWRCKPRPVDLRKAIGLTINFDVEYTFRVTIDVTDATLEANPLNNSAEFTILGEDLLACATGACCLDGDLCEDVTATECLEMEGVYMGDNSTCAESDCSDVSPCFVPGIGSFVTTDDACLDSDGAVECLTLPAPSEFTCTPSGDAIDLVWANNGPYDAITVLRNDVEIAILAGSDSSFTDFDPALGENIYRIGGVSDLDGCTALSAPCIAEFMFCESPLSVISNAGPTVSVQSVGTEFSEREVAVFVDVTHSALDELTLELESPSGTSVTLHDGATDLGTNLRLTFSDSGTAYGSSSLDCDCQMQSSGPGTLADFSEEGTSGDWILRASDSASPNDGTLNAWCLVFRETGETFIRGDANGDGAFFGFIDALYLLEFAFVGGPAAPCEKAADADGNGALFSFLDALYILQFSFTGGPAPGTPFPNCGDDSDNLSSRLSCDVGTCTP